MFPQKSATAPKFLDAWVLLILMCHLPNLQSILEHSIPLLVLLLY